MLMVYSPAYLSLFENTQQMGKFTYINLNNTILPFFRSSPIITTSQGVFAYKSALFNENGAEVFIQIVCQDIPRHDVQISCEHISKHQHAKVNTVTNSILPPM